MSAPSTERAAELLAACDERDREVLGGLVDYEVPAEVLAAHPGFAPLDPSTWPEPDRCVEGRPWGVDPYGSVWGTGPDRWPSWLNGRVGRPCRNRWRDEATRLCGTHLNAYNRTRVDADRRLRRARWHAEATELCRQLAALGVDADPGTAGVVLRPDAARALVEVLTRAMQLGLVEAARVHRDEVTAGGLLYADRDALLDLLGAAERTLPPDRSRVALPDLGDAVGRARRHIERTTRPTPTPNPEQ